MESIKDWRNHEGREQVLSGVEKMPASLSARVLTKFTRIFGNCRTERAKYRWFHQTGSLDESWTILLRWHWILWSVKYEFTSGCLWEMWNHTFAFHPSRRRLLFATELFAIFACHSLWYSWGGLSHCVNIPELSPSHHVTAKWPREMGSATKYRRNPEEGWGAWVVGMKRDWRVCGYLWPDHPGRLGWVIYCFCLWSQPWWVMAIAGWLEWHTIW